MPATLTSSGTWTTLTTTVPAATGPNDPSATNLSPRDFATVPSEIDQMIRLAMAGWGTNYWAACMLLRDWFTATMNGSVPNKISA